MMQFVSSRNLARVLVGALVATVAFPSVGAAVAAESDSVLGPLSAVQQVAPQLLEDLASPIRAKPGIAVRAEEEGSIVEVPTDAADGLTLAKPGYFDKIVVHLPAAEQASTAKLVDDAVVAYDNGDGSETTVLSYDDGSVRVASIINDSTAPTEYAYEMELPEGATLNSNGDGAVVILDGEGNYLTAVAAPWALDASGASVETSYRIDGHSLIQVVDHAGASYPVVADPWFGLPIVKSFTWTGTDRLNVTPHDYARLWNAVTQAPVILAIGAAGWDELYGRQTTYNKRLMNASMRDQWICHQAYASFDPIWNLERLSPNNGLAWHISRKCQ